MVVRGWGGSVATAIGAAAAAGAAQLGVGYGLAVISWPVHETVTSQAWYASLGWATWVAASSTIVGAIIADRLTRRPSASAPTPDPDEPAAPTASPETDPAQPTTGTGESITTQPEVATDRLTPLLRRLVLAIAAALGAAATVLLVAVPARHAVVAETTSPHTVAAGYAVLGVIAGLVLAVGALAARAVAANLLTSIAWLWLLATVVVIEGVFAEQEWARVPLGFWEVGTGGAWFRNVLLPDAAIALAAALVIGALAALPAIRRGDPPIGVVLSGAAGPLLVASAYLLAQPDLTGLEAEAVDLSRQLTAPYLVLAGLVGSLLVAMLGPRAADPAGSAPEPEPAADQDAGAASDLDDEARPGRISDRVPAERAPADRLD